MSKIENTRNQQSILIFHKIGNQSNQKFHGIPWGKKRNVDILKYIYIKKILLIPDHVEKDAN